MTRRRFVFMRREGALYVFATPGSFHRWAFHRVPVAAFWGGRA